MRVAWRIGIAAMGIAGGARADEAIVAVRGPVERPPIVERADDAAIARDARDACDARDARDPCDRRAPSSARVSLGGAAGAMDRAGAHGLGGLDVALDLGSGVVGGRVGAAWLRTDDGSSGLAHYGAEVTVDAIPRGPWHPIAGIGVGLARTNGANAGVGTLRVGIAYALPVRDADVRVTIAALGALPGPADADAAELRAYAMGVASLGVGF